MRSYVRAEGEDEEKESNRGGILLYYYTSHKFAMLKLHRPEGENSYYHPAII